MSHHESSGLYEHPGSTAPCKVCSSPVIPEHRFFLFGICHHCVYKILMVVFVAMIAISYIAWFGVF